MDGTARLAVLDIGSNSVRLMVADLRPGGVLCPVDKRLKTTRLSAGLGRAGSLTESAMNRTVDAIAEFNKAAGDMGASQVFSFATAAVRVARNREEFIRGVHKRTGLLVHVLTEEEEALAGFAGAQVDGPYGVIDIGGGSAELAVGKDREPQASVSLNVGAVRLSERYPLGDIADPLCMEAMTQTTQSVLARETGPIREALDRIGGLQWVGVGGTVTALAAMELKMVRYDRERIQGQALGREAVGRWKQKLASMRETERRALPGLTPERADIILAGVVILGTIMDFFQIGSIRVSDRDNLEGYLLMRAGREGDKL